jgi:hypothetical protein
VHPDDAARQEDCYEHNTYKSKDRRADVRAELIRIDKNKFIFISCALSRKTTHTS